MMEDGPIAAIESGEEVGGGEGGEEAEGSGEEVGFDGVHGTRIVRHLYGMGKGKRSRTQLGVHQRASY
jgi:hypothetical protein